MIVRGADAELEPILQIVELIILALLAGVVLYQLWAVLGRRVGRQPEDAAAVAVADGSRVPLAPPLEEGPAMTGLAALRANDPGFDVGKFLDGARSAYELIVKAFATGDRETLKRLLSADTYGLFESAIDQREAEGRTETVDFLHPPRADLESAEVTDEAARARVRFLGEYRSRTKGPEGEGVDDRRTAEIWTFERPLKNQDPNWTLVRVDAAEA